MGIRDLTTGLILLIVSLFTCASGSYAKYSVEVISENEGYYIMRKAGRVQMVRDARILQQRFLRIKFNFHGE